MFGIGGSEIIFILFIILMLFGSDKVPEFARALGKLMAQLKNATNDIKGEIQKGADGVGINSTINDITTEINSAKDSLISDGESTLTKVQQDIEEATGPIKRQF